MKKQGHKREMFDSIFYFMIAKNCMLNKMAFILLQEEALGTDFKNTYKVKSNKKNSLKISRWVLFKRDKN